MKFRIQLVQANAVPSAPLKIDVEEREIREKITKAAIVLRSPAPRLADIIVALRKKNVDVVHFSAHGSPAKEIILFSKENAAEPIPKTSLSKLFRQYRGQIRLVVLNACFSSVQARAIAKFIECVIGVREAIPEEAARRYSVQFYDALASGTSIKNAHEEAEIAIGVDRLHKSQRPQLIHSKDVNPASIYLTTPANKTKPKKQKASPETKAFLKSKKTLYEDNADRLRVSAESFSLRKVYLPDGSSDLFFELKELRYEGDGEINGLSVVLETQAGLVSAPQLDRRAADLHIRWISDPYPEAATMEDAIDRVRKSSGTFWLDQPLRRDFSYTFGWKVHIFNGDAFTVWDFDNLYRSAKSLQHVNGNLLDVPTEFLARLVWLPVRKLETTLQFLPGSKFSPRLRYFDLKDSPLLPNREVIGTKNLDFDGEVVTGNVLQLFPSTTTDWFKASAKWEANFARERAEITSLRHEGDNSWTLAVDYPRMGSYYSIDLTLSSPEISREEERRIRQAAEIRKAFLAHRDRRINKNLNTISDRITSVVECLDAKLRARFASHTPEENFTTTLMTYDDVSHRLVVVEGRKNGAELPERSWNFYLPFGLGTAGACFRAGAGAFTYSEKLDNGNPMEPENYVPMPGSDKHAFLLAVPIDHPNLYAPDSFDRESENLAQRCRQLVGVLTMGSTSGVSPLLEYCRQRPKEEAEYKKLLKSLEELRNECQDECDKICHFLLGKGK